MIYTIPNDYKMIEYSFVTNPVYPWAIIRIKWYVRLWWKVKKICRKIFSFAL